MKADNAKKKGQEEKKILANVEHIPKFVSAIIFAAAIPQTYLMYPMIWADPCSDTFFWTFELSMTWIASLSALEGAAGVSLGYIDYQTTTGNT